jgi:integrase
MDALKQLLITRKPDASETTIKGYVNNINLLYKNMTGENVFNKEKFDAFTTDELTDCIMNEGQTKSKAYLRNMLSALKAYRGDPSLTKLITDNSNSEKIDADNTEATEYIKNHHLTPEIIENKFNELKTIADGLWDRTDLEFEDFQQLQQFVMYCLVCGKYIAPRRSQDWIKMKIRNIDLDTDNYIDKKSFVFNQFKTAKHTGTQIIDIPPELYRIIRKWIRFNRFEYLFVNVKLEPLTPVSYAQKLNNIMGVKSGRTGGYSTNNWRHVYLTNKYSNTLDLEDDLKAMGSDNRNAKYYIKKV